MQQKSVQLSEEELGAFRPIGSCPGYLVSDDGRVCSLRGKGGRPRPHGILIFRGLNREGYERVFVTVDGRRRCRLVHQLVAEAFLPPRPSDSHVVRHIDGRPAHNVAANLRWGTKRENADDRARHAMTARGWRHSQAIRKGLAAARGARGGAE